MHLTRSMRIIDPATVQGLQRMAGNVPSLGSNNMFEHLCKVA
jgi:hypothetical protein